MSALPTHAPSSCRRARGRGTWEARYSERMGDTRAEIDGLIAIFFDAFCNKERPADVDRLKGIFLPGGTVTKRTPGAEIEVWSLEAFLAPRRELLRSGTVTDFAEEETSARTEIAMGLAQRLSTYRKSGKREGVPFEGRGTKMFHLVKA